MKKALLSFLLLVACTSFAMAQHVDRVDVSACQTYTWSINGETYTNDTVVVAMNATFDTIHVLNLTINNPFISNETIVSTTCQYMWRNDTITTSGNYQDIVEAAAGAGLCDSTFNASITIPSAVYDTTVVDACNNYVWMADTLTATGLYYDTIPGANCQEIQVLDLTISAFNHVNETTEHCGSSYAWHNNTLVTSGTYTDTITSAEGLCDTLYTLHLTLTSYQNSYDTVQQCGKYNWNGTFLLTAGDYTDTIENAETNCNTIAHLNLTIVVDTMAQTANACGEKDWIYTRGIRAIQDTITITTTGFYYELVVDTVSQCVTYSSMDATIKAPRQGYKNDTLTKCNEFAIIFASINGSNTRRFYESIEFDTILKDHRMSMCNDSNIHISLTINKSFRDTITEKACDKFYWALNERTYTKTPDKPVTAYYGSDSNGCDSITIMNLTIKKSPVISAINGEWNLTAGDTAILYPTCTGSPVYTWSYNGQTSHADTLIIPNVQGNFDVTLTADINNTDIDLVCSDTSWITIVTYVGIDGVAAPSVSLYPNPTVGQLNIESAENVQEVAIFNTIGQQVAVKTHLGTQCTMNLSNLSKGTYTMRLLLQNGETVTRKFVITK